MEPPALGDMPNEDLAVSRNLDECKVQPESALPGWRDDPEHAAGFLVAVFDADECGRRGISVLLVHAPRASSRPAR